MIGVVVVTHGHLATELLNAAETIVGDLPRFTALSIGWHEDVRDAREEIAQAIERVRGESGVLVLTDMFGGTPGRGDQRDQPADADQGCQHDRPRRSAGSGPRVARARPQRDLGGVRSAARTEDVTSRAVTVTNQLGLHARAAARFVHLAARFESQIRVGHDVRVMDGKSIMGILLLAAACGTTITITADGPDEADAVDALCGLVSSGFGEETWSG
jgi:phosphocarrier protein HPr